MKRPYEQPICETFHVEHTRLLEVSIRHQDGDHPITVTNNASEICNFTTEPLGWVYDDGNITTYSLPRKARVTVRQTVGSDPQTATFIITQNNSVGSGHCTLYQFGRKDAFPGTDSNLSGNFSTAGQGRVSYATAISNPGTFYRYDSTEPVNYDWNDSHPTNAWSANNASNDANTTVVKTVYDPCPVGYHMPQRNAFTGFTSTGDNTSDAAQFNVSGSFVRGWNFWTNSTHAATIFFPASGYRRYGSGALAAVGSRGDFWSAVPISTSSGRDLSFGVNSVNPICYDPCAYAFGVRPVKE